jgi:two-component system, NarL family, nitrate/nitrite response regulator NarL
MAVKDPRTAIRLLVVDDHEMFREGLSRALEKEPDFEVVGQCHSAAEALPLLEHGVAIVLLDVDLGTERGLEFVEAAKKLGYEGQILVVTAGISGVEAVNLIQAGVAGIMHKQHSTQALCQNIRKVAAGQSCIEPDYITPLFRSVDQSQTSAKPKLTERDRVVLRAIFQGLTNKDIAGSIGISEGAVKASIRQLFDKLGVRTRAQAVKVALEQHRDQL